MSHEHGPRSARCREIFAQLSEYIDEELPADVCERINDHMTDCPPCEAFLESLRQTVRLTADLPRDRLPDEVRRSVRKAWRRLQDDRSG